MMIAPPGWSACKKPNVKGIPSINQAQRILKFIGDPAGFPENHG
jgi:hypothetical protein